MQAPESGLCIKGDRRGHSGAQQLLSKSSAGRYACSKQCTRPCYSSSWRRMTWGRHCKAPAQNRLKPLLFSKAARALVSRHYLPQDDLRAAIALSSLPQIPEE